jgi:WD40 repeat protein
MTEIPVRRKSSGTPPSGRSRKLDFFIIVVADLGCLLLALPFLGIFEIDKDLGIFLAAGVMNIGVAWEYFLYAARVDRMRAEPRPLAYWSYSDAEWSRYLQDHHPFSQTTLAVTGSMAFAVFSLVALTAAILGLTGDAPPQATPLSLGFLIGLIGFFCSIRYRITGFEAPGRVRLEPDAVLINRFLFKWAVRGAALTDVRLDDKDGHYLVFDLKVKVRASWMRRTIYVPVPASDRDKGRELREFYSRNLAGLASMAKTRRSTESEDVAERTGVAGQLTKAVIGLCIIIVCFFLFTTMLFFTSRSGLTATMTGHPSGVAQMRYSGDGKYIASCPLPGSGDDKLCLWDASTGEPIREMSFDRSLATDVFFADGGRIVVGVFTSGVATWETASGKPIASMPLERYEYKFGDDGYGLYQHARSTASPDGRYVATQSRCVELMELATGRQTRVICPVEGREVVDFAVAPDNTLIVCEAGPDTLHVIRHAGAIPAEICRLRITRLLGLPPSLFFSRDRSHLAVEAGDSIAILDLSKAVIEVYLPCDSGIQTVLDISPDNSRLLGFGRNGLYVWDLSRGLLQEIPLPLPAADISFEAISPDWKYCAVRKYKSRALRLIDLSRSEIVATVDHRENVLSLKAEAWRVRFSPDGRHLATARRLIKTWDIEALAR